MFYKKGIDITKDKSMFNFLKNHFCYFTGNAWNGNVTFANNVKLYNLNLDGDTHAALDFLHAEGYDVIDDMISLWKYYHPGYTVAFNGRSGGYLVLYALNPCADSDNYTVLSAIPDYIADSEDYQEYKQWCFDNNFVNRGFVKANREALVEMTKLVRDFDALCDELREYTNQLSKIDFIAMQTQLAVEDFNWKYNKDLRYCNFDYLEVTADNKVNIQELQPVQALIEAFSSLLGRRTDLGYTIALDDKFMWLEKE